MSPRGQSIHRVRIAVRTTLLAATILATAPVMAQNQSAKDQNVEARVNRLEALVEGLIERLEAQARVSAQQSAVLNTEQANQIAAMRQQAEAALQAAQTLGASHTQLAAQIDTPPKPGPDGFGMGKTRVTYGRYIKVDGMSQRTSGGQLPATSLLRDFLVPAAIPVGGEASGFDINMSARQTRFIFKTATDVGARHTLNSHIELDFLVTEGGDERVSNSFVPRIRQGFITYDNWLIGQTWSTFMDVGALPDSVDFIGVTPGTPFNRQPMVRWTKGGLQLAVEQPETVVTTPMGGRIEAGDDALPDFVAKYNLAGAGGRVSLAGIVRSLKVSNDDFGTGDDSALGYGLALSGKLDISPARRFPL